MKRLTLTTALVVLGAPAFAQDDSCTGVTITEMGWASASVVTNVANFIMEQGYGCEVEIVPSDTVPAITSVAENGEPDIVTELWVNLTGDVYDQLIEEDRIVELGPVLDPGAIDGWWIPTYLAEEHPELTSIEGILENPDLVGGMFHNCPEGWGCRVVNDNLLPAFGVADSGIEVFDHGSGETLASSLASAYESEEPWFGYYWAPTALLGRYDMTQVDLGDYNEEAYTAAQNQDAQDVGQTDFPEAPVVTAVTTDFSDQYPDLTEFLSSMTFQLETMNEVVAWMEDNAASGEEGAVYYLTNNQDVWSGWINDSAAENLQQVMQQQ